MSLSYPQINNSINVIANLPDLVDGKKTPRVTVKKYVAADATNNAPTDKPQKDLIPIAARSVRPVVLSVESDRGTMLEGAANLPFALTMSAVQPEPRKCPAVVTEQTTTGVLPGLTKEQILAGLRKRFQPALGDTPQAEKEAFIKSLDAITRGLDGKEKTKTVLLHIMDRFRATGYKFDIGADGTLTDVTSPLGSEWKTFFSNTKEYSLMGNFWIRTAIDSKHLPKGSNYLILAAKQPEGTTAVINPFSAAVYDAPSGEAYILDPARSSRFLMLSDHRKLTNDLKGILTRASGPDAPDENLPNVIIPGYPIRDDYLNNKPEWTIDQCISDEALIEKIYLKNKALYLKSQGAIELIEPVKPVDPGRLTKPQIWAGLQKKFQPTLGHTPQEEKEVFIKSLDVVTKGLEGKEKSKAVLWHIMERFKATGFRLEADKRFNLHRLVVSPLSCEWEQLMKKPTDYHAMINFWVKTAIDSNHLPAGSENFVGIQYLPIAVSNAFDEEYYYAAMYKSPDGDYYFLDPSKSGTFLPAADYQKLNSLFKKELEIFSPRQTPESILKRDELNNLRVIMSEDYVKRSSAPLDKSISTEALKEKIYNNNKDDYLKSLPRPPGCTQGTANYGDLLARYSDRDFYDEKMVSVFETPTKILPGVGSAIAEGTAATGFALYKRSKIKHRQHYVTASYNVKKQHQKKPKYYDDTPTTFQQFKDLMHLSSFIDSDGLDVDTRAVVGIVSGHKHYQQADDIRNLVKNLLTLFPDNDQLGPTIDTIDQALLSNPKTLAILQEKLNTYGITIGYQKAGALKQQVTDKFRKRKNEKSTAVLHRVVINKKKLYHQLEQHKKLPDSELIATTVDNKSQAINTMNDMRDYDDWKLRYINQDTGIKIGAATAGIIPIIPAYDTVRVGAYVKEKRYRSHNKANMTQRITNSLKALEERKICFTDEQYQALHACLNNVQEVKTRHIVLKENKARAMQAIHTTSAIAALFTDILGPIGSGARSAAKGAAKIAGSAYPMVQRYRGDKKQHEQHTFNTSNDVYKLYKELYLLADEHDKTSLKSAILKLAEHSFDLNPHEFDVLAGTELVESNQLKLSFCRPTGKRARVASSEKAYSETDASMPPALTEHIMV